MGPRYESNLFEHRGSYEKELWIDFDSHFLR